MSDERTEVSDAATADIARFGGLALGNLVGTIMQIQGATLTNSEQLAALAQQALSLAELVITLQQQVHTLEQQMAAR